MFKSLPDLSPVYIKELLVRKPTSSRAMRSHDQNFLFVPVSHIATYGDQNFKRLAPDMWNKPPTEPRLCDEMEAFKIHLKSLLFKDAFYWLRIVDDYLLNYSNEVVVIYRTFVWPTNFSKLPTHRKIGGRDIPQISLVMQYICLGGVRGCHPPDKQDACPIPPEDISILLLTSTLS